ACADVERHDVALDVLSVRRRPALRQRRADDDDAVADDGCRAVADASNRIERRRQIELLEEIDRTAVAEVVNRNAGLRVEREQLEAGRDRDDSSVRAVGPVRDAAPDFSWSLLESFAFIRPPRP